MQIAEQQATNLLCRKFSTQKSERNKAVRRGKFFFLLSLGETLTSYREIMKKP
jgi:hypothetical protein